MHNSAIECIVIAGAVLASSLILSISVSIYLCMFVHNPTVWLRRCT